MRERRLAGIVRALEPMEPRKIVLFGSAARGTADQYSDLDVVVVADKVATRFHDRIGDALGLIMPDYGLDILVYTPEEYARMLDQENPFLEMVEREGRVIYERPAA